MAYNLKIQSLNDLYLIKTSRSNYAKTIDIATNIITNYGSFVVIDPNGNYNKVKIARDVEARNTITQVKTKLRSSGVNLSGMSIEFGNGSAAGGSKMSAVTTAQQENATLAYCRALIENGKPPSFGEMQSIYPAVDDEWFDSFDATAKALKKWLGNQKGYLYSRDEKNGMMPFLEKIAKDCCGVTTKDNWNPMDIVIVKARKAGQIMGDIQKICTSLDSPRQALDALNEKMRAYSKTKDLMGISLKKVNPKRRIVTELSDPKVAMAKPPNIELKSINLNWDVIGQNTGSPVFNTGELSFDLMINGYKTAMQVRAFSGGARERNQFDMTQSGASAKLGKVSGPLAIDPFLKQRGMNRFEMRDMPKVDQWTTPQIDYWVGVFDSLRSASIGGVKINWGSNNSTEEWETMLKMVIAGEKDNKRLASQLSSKLQSLYFLSNMVRMNDVNSFFEVCYYGAKKQYQRAGVFLKISD